MVKKKLVQVLRDRRKEKTSIPRIEDGIQLEFFSVKFYRRSKFLPWIENKSILTISTCYADVKYSREEKKKREQSGMEARWKLRRLSWNWIGLIYGTFLFFTKSQQFRSIDNFFSPPFVRFSPRILNAINHSPEEHNDLQIAVVFNLTFECFTPY